MLIIGHYFDFKFKLELGYIYEIHFMIIKGVLERFVHKSVLGLNL